MECRAPCISPVQGIHICADDIKTCYQRIAWDIMVNAGFMVAEQYIYGPHKICSLRCHLP